MAINKAVDDLELDKFVEDNESKVAVNVKVKTIDVLPLPNGAATSAKQDTGNNSLSSIDSKVATEATLDNIDTKVNTFKQNPQTNALAVLDYSHHEIHSGSHFTFSYTQDIPNGANADVLIVTPDTTKYAHFFLELQSELESHFYFYEGVTTSNNGTTAPAYNSNRNSETTPTTLTYHTPTVTGTGTLIWECHVGSGRTMSGASRNEGEFILKRNTKYLLRITNQTANNNHCCVSLIWYEHTDL